MKMQPLKKNDFTGSSLREVVPWLDWKKLATQHPELMVSDAGEDNPEKGYVPEEIHLRFRRKAFNLYRRYDVPRIGAGPEVSPEDIAKFSSFLRENFSK
jgi:hypothetical protein